MKFIYMLLIPLIIGLFSFPHVVLGCTIETREVYWNQYCVGPEEWYDFSWDLLSAINWVYAVGPSSYYGHENEYWVKDSNGACVEKQDVVWRSMEIERWPDDAKKGEICIVRKDRWEGFCYLMFGGTSEYRFDPNDGGCVHCIGPIQGIIYDGELEEPENTCESACGADSECDEKLPGSRSCTNTCLYYSTGAGGGEGRRGFRNVLLDLGYTNILTILTVVVIIIMLVFGGFKLFARKKW